MISKAMIKASVQNIVGWLVAVGAFLVGIPVMTGSFGVEVMGIYLLMSVLSGYVGTLVSPMGEAATKYLAEYRQREDATGFAHVLQSALSIQLVTVAALGGALWLLALLLVTNVFAVSAGLRAEAITVIQVMSVVVVLQGIFSLLNSAFIAYTDFFLLNLFQALYSALAIVIGCVVAIAGRPVHYCFVGNAALLAVLVVAQALCVKRKTPEIRFLPRYDRALYKKLIGFGSWSTANQVGGLLNFQLGRTVAAIVIGIATLPYYAIPNSVMSYMQLLFGRVALFFFPTVSAAHASGRVSELRASYASWMRLFIVSGAFGSSYLITRSTPLLSLWMDPGFAEHSTWIFRLLAIWVFWHSVGTVTFNVANGMGRPSLNALNAATLGISSLILMLVLTKPYGLVGIAAAMCVSNSLVLPWYILRVQSALLGIDYRQFGRAVLLPILPVIFLGSVMSLLTMWAVSPSGPASFLLDAAVSACIWLAMALMLRLIAVDDLRNLFARRPSADRGPIAL